MCLPQWISHVYRNRCTWDLSDNYCSSGNQGCNKIITVLYLQSSKFQHSHEKSMWIFTQEKLSRGTGQNFGTLNSYDWVMHLFTDMPLVNPFSLCKCRPLKQVFYEVIYTLCRLTVHSTMRANFLVQFVE